MSQETFELGYKSYEELFEKGIVYIFTKGVNSLGLLEKTIICRDNTVWYYNAEDDIYERDYDSEYFNF